MTSGIHVLVDAITPPGPEPRGWSCRACRKITARYDEMFADRSCPGHPILVESTARRSHRSGRSSTPP